MLLSAAVLLPVLCTVFLSLIPEEVIENTIGGLISGKGGLTRGNFNDFSCFTLKQYETVLISGPDYLFRFWRSVLLVVPIVLFQLLFAIPSAYAFSQSRSKLLQAIFFLYILQFMVPEQVTAIPVYLLIKRASLTDTDWSVWLPGIFSGFSIYLLSRQMVQIPREVLDQARLDGAGEGRVLLFVAIPLSKAEIAACAILLFAEYWNMVEYPIIMFSNELEYPLSVYLSRIQEGAAGISFASAVIYMIPPLLVFLAGEEYLTEGLIV